MNRITTEVIMNPGTLRPMVVFYLNGEKITSLPYARHDEAVELSEVQKAALVAVNAVLVSQGKECIMPKDVEINTEVKAP